MQEENRRLPRLRAETPGLRRAGALPSVTRNDKKKDCRSNHYTILELIIAEPQAAK
jgi:hypothetical protein